MDTTDPFNIVKGDTLLKIQEMKQFYTKWKGMMNSKQFSNVDWYIDQIKKQISEIEEFLAALQQTIDYVERNPQKYANKVTASELLQRKNFVQDTRKQASDVKQEIERSLVANKAKQNTQNKAMLMPVENQDKYSKLDDDIEKDNQNFIDQQLLEQGRIKERQEKHLDEVHDGIVRIKGIAEDMGDELDKQHEMLGTLESEAGKTKSLLQRANNQMANLLKGSDKWKLIIIIVLVLIIVVMVIVFFSLSG